MGSTEKPSFKSTPPSENNLRALGLTVLNEENICQSPQQVTSQNEIIRTLVTCIEDLDERTKKIEDDFRECAVYISGVQKVMEQVRDELYGLKEREFGLKTSVDSICKSLGISTIQGNPARLPKSARQS
ncbi:hypothetical protein PENNAL_c0109G09972 [Penicillium nalgiovense]|uniref:Uncharacterized protein n=1 Tax=Penicillium nalgiovense TaxID=60175 RepID=A0A1V6X7Q0_PENNA|nr:hypothetical protein PENNAL_c0109G09972 [Penicillium nalgiovense]